jgi:hypothetical protein
MNESQINQVKKPLNEKSLANLGGSSTRERGRDKINMTCAWIGMFVRTTEPIILRLLGTKMRGWMLKLEKKGLVSRHTSGLKTANVWYLTSIGLKIAQAELEDDLLHYPARPDKRSEINLRHDLVVQHIVLDMNPVEYRSSFFLHRGKKNSWIPDAIVTLDDDTQVGIEVETNPKYGMEREQKLARIVKCLNEYPMTKVLWASHHAKAIDDYIEAMREGVPLWEYRNDQWLIKRDSDHMGRFENVMISLDDPLTVEKRFFSRDPRISM